MVSVQRLPGALGAEIRSIDLSDRLDDGEILEVLEAFYENQVIIIPHQTLTSGQFARFARYFGRPQPHIRSDLRHPEHPEILPLSNVFEDGEPVGIYDGAAYWHTDMSYEEEPAGATIVYSIKAPKEGGETLFANMYAAYNDLPADMKTRIDGLHAMHHYGNRDDTDETSRTSAAPLGDEQKKKVSNVYHPLVRRHPVTGRKALYGVGGSSFGILGMPDADAIALLDDLQRHATRPAYVQRHKYAAGDVVAWDNASTLHSATLIEPATGPSDTRLLHRISVKGIPPKYV